MKTFLLTQAIKLFLSLLTPKMLVKFADYVLDFIENFVIGTKSEIDDKTILPLVKMIRTTFDIPDDD